MKYAFAILIFIFPFLIGSACGSRAPVPESKNSQNTGEENDESMSSKITIKIGDKTFVATLLTLNIL